jgi:hypothetical protein
MSKISLSPKLRRYADLLYQGIDQTNAYARAGFKPDSGNASRAASRDDVQAYLAAKNSRSNARLPKETDAAVDRGEPLDYQDMAQRAFAVAERRGDTKAMLAPLRS